MKIKVLNLGNLAESTRDIDIDVENDRGRKSVPVVVKWQLAKRRAGTAKVKDLPEISGTTKKPHRQKGTGSARQGSLRNAHFVGGVKIFGPQPKDFGYKVPRKIVQAALGYVLREKIKNGELILIEGMADVPVSTKDLNKKLTEKNINKALFAINDEYDNFSKSLRNIVGHKKIIVEALNVYDVLKHNFVLVDNSMFDKLMEEVL